MELQFFSADYFLDSHERGFLVVNPDEDKTKWIAEMREQAKRGAWKDTIPKKVLAPEAKRRKWTPEAIAGLKEDLGNNMKPIDIAAKRGWSVAAVYMAKHKFVEREEE